MVLPRVRAIHGELEAPERHPIDGEIDKLREVLSAISRELRALIGLPATSANDLSIYVTSFRFWRQKRVRRRGYMAIVETGRFHSKERSDVVPVAAAPLFALAGTLAAVIRARL